MYHFLATLYGYQNRRLEYELQISKEYVDIKN